MAAFTLEGDHTLMQEVDRIADLYDDDDGRCQPVAEAYAAISQGWNGCEGKYARRGMMGKIWVDAMEGLGVGRDSARHAIAQIQAETIKGLVKVWDGFRAEIKGDGGEGKLSIAMEIELVLESDGIGGEERQRVRVLSRAKHKRFFEVYKDRKGREEYSAMDAYHT